MRSGTLRERKAREVASSPAWGLAVSLRGRGSISKGDLLWMGRRAGMADYRHTVYNVGKQKSASHRNYFVLSEIYAAIRARVCAGNLSASIRVQRPKSARKRVGAPLWRGSALKNCVTSPGAGS